MAESLLSVQPLTSLAQEQVGDIISEIKQFDKEIFIEESLWLPMGVVVSLDTLKSMGVKAITPLPETACKPAHEAVVVMITANVTIVRQVADIIRQHPECQYTLIFSPRRSPSCDKILEKEGVFGNVTITELNLSLLQADNDLVTLEVPDFFRHTAIDTVTTPHYQVAQAMVAIHALNGIIERTCGLGVAARSVYDMSRRMMLDCGDELVQSTLGMGQPKRRIGTMLILERQMDMLTPLLQAETLEGLVDHFIGIKLGIVELASIEGPPISLASLGRVYKDMRMLAFDEAVKELTRLVDEASESKFESEIVPLVEVFGAAEKLPKTHHTLKNVALLVHHIWFCLHHKQQHEYLRMQKFLLESQAAPESNAKGHVEHKDNVKAVNFIKDWMYCRSPATSALALMCILSQLRGGLPEQTFRELKTIYVHTYGFEHVLTFRKLETLGIFNRMNDRDAKECIYSGSLLVRAVDNAIMGLPVGEGIDLHTSDRTYDRSFEAEHSLKDFSSRYAQYNSEANGDLKRSTSTSSDEGQDTGGNVQRQDAIVVVVLGGITSDELQNIRTRALMHKREIVICTTRTMNTFSFLDECTTPRKQCV